MTDLIRRDDAMLALNAVAAWANRDQMDTVRYAIKNIHDVEAIDAVPVVRCKDCKNRGTPYSCPMRKLVMPWQGAGSYEDCTEDEGYCHMGKRKDGGAD